MVINILDLKSKFINRQFKIAFDELADRGIDYAQDTISCVLSSRSIENGTKLIGDVKTKVNYQCSRCLEYFA